MNPDTVIDQPAGDTPARSVLLWWLVGVTLLFVSIAGVGAVAVMSGAGDGQNAAHAVPAGPLDLRSVPEAIAAHYQYAEAHETEFAAIPCFCGCEEFLAHRDLYDCFIRDDGAGYDRHAAGCGVCIGEASVATQLLDQGMTAPEVARRIVERFGSTPTTAPDQTVPLRT